jgi:hypothetical protein
MRPRGVTWERWDTVGMLSGAGRIVVYRQRFW